MRSGGQASPVPAALARLSLSVQQRRASAAGRGTPRPRPSGAKAVSAGGGLDRLSASSPRQAFSPAAGSRAAKAACSLWLKETAPPGKQGRPLLRRWSCGSQMPGSAPASVRQAASASRDSQREQAARVRRKAARCARWADESSGESSADSMTVSSRQALSVAGSGQQTMWTVTSASGARAGRRGAVWTVGWGEGNPLASRGRGFPSPRPHPSPSALFQGERAVLGALRFAEGSPTPFFS